MPDPELIPLNVFEAATESADALIDILNKHRCSEKDAQFILDMLRETLFLAIREYERRKEQQDHTE